MNEVRYWASIDVAREILATLALPCEPGPLSKIAYLVLETIYRCETELAAAEASKAVRGGCLSSLPLDPACLPVVEPCPRCGQPMGLAATASLN